MGFGRGGNTRERWRERVVREMEREGSGERWRERVVERGSSETGRQISSRSVRTERAGKWIKDKVPGELVTNNGGETEGLEAIRAEGLKSKRRVTGKVKWYRNRGYCPEGNSVW